MDATAAVGFCTLNSTYCDVLTDFARRASGVLLPVVASSFHGRQPSCPQPLPSSNDHECRRAASPEVVRRHFSYIHSGYPSHE
ncbi:hypothetical protein Pan54_23860 [Rubinisphaera italica]|uniref:Uncharacterized protein n=1 Tax=Rubinisphaera italica TaxID=2527969 RepID=A0A5C5XG60_9PLAN|nr:hypothetical protein Pan54_23860 [Rubinisphaera italica]